MSSRFPESIYDLPKKPKRITLKIKRWKIRDHQSFRRAGVLIQKESWVLEVPLRNWWEAEEAMFLFRTITQPIWYSVWVWQTKWCFWHISKLKSQPDTLRNVTGEDITKPFGFVSLFPLCKECPVTCILISIVIRYRRLDCHRWSCTSIQYEERSLFASSNSVMRLRNSLYSLSIRSWRYLLLRSVSWNFFRNRVFFCIMQFWSELYVFERDCYLQRTSALGLGNTIRLSETCIFKLINCFCRRSRHVFPCFKYEQSIFTLVRF